MSDHVLDGALTYLVHWTYLKVFDKSQEITTCIVW